MNTKSSESNKFQLLFNLDILLRNKSIALVNELELNDYYNTCFKYFYSVIKKGVDFKLMKRKNLTKNLNILFKLLWSIEKKESNAIFFCDCFSQIMIQFVEKTREICDASKIFPEFLIRQCYTYFEEFSRYVVCFENKYLCYNSEYFESSIPICQASLDCFKVLEKIFWKMEDEKIKIEPIIEHLRKENDKFIQKIKKKKRNNSNVESKRDYKFYTHYKREKEISKEITRQAKDLYFIRVSKQKIFSLPSDIKIIFSSKKKVIDKWLYSKMNTNNQANSLFGVDCEWDYNKHFFMKEFPIDLIQICSSDSILLINTKNGNIPFSQSIRKFFESENLLKCWFDFSSDVENLQSWAKKKKELPINFRSMINIREVEKFKEKNMDDVSQALKLGAFLKDRITRKSRWSALNLTRKQMRYAALDAYFCKTVGNILLKEEMEDLKIQLKKVTLDKSDEEIEKENKLEDKEKEELISKKKKEINSLKISDQLKEKLKILRKLRLDTDCSEKTVEEVLKKLKYHKENFRLVVQELLNNN